MAKKYDVIISGAGPSGALLGFLLSSKNINTLLLDKKTFPRHKVCAGGLQHRAYILLPFDVEDVIERQIKEIYFTRKDRDPFKKSYAEPFIYTVRREKFDDYLLKKASQKGCSIKTSERLLDYDVQKKKVKINTQRAQYECSVLVGADGVNGTVHRSLIDKTYYQKIIGYETDVDMGQQRTDRPFEKEWYQDCLRLDFSGVRRGYCWVFPKADKLNCGIGGPIGDALRLKRYFMDFLKNNYSDESTQDLKISAAIIPVRHDDTPFMRERVLAVGDAACLGDGFTGEGLYNALRSSLLASESISKAFKKDDFSFTDYAYMLEEEIFKDIRISLNFARKYYALPSFYYKLLKFNDRFFRLCCKVMRGEVRYRDISERLKFIRY